MIKPPKVGPMAGASMVAMPPSSCGRPRFFSSGNSRNMVANEAGIRPPPRKPCKARNTTIEPRLQEKPQATLDRVKPIAAMV